jgi:hypothetical protein
MSCALNNGDDEEEDEDEDSDHKLTALRCSHVILTNQPTNQPANSVQLMTTREDTSCETPVYFSQHFREPEGSLPLSQEPTTCPYP